jgi:hypothetical protein
VNCIHSGVNLVGAKQLIFQSGVLLLQRRPRRSLYAACMLSALPSGEGTPARRGECVNARGERYTCKQRGGGTNCARRGECVNERGSDVHVSKGVEVQIVDHGERQVN